MAGMKKDRMMSAAGRKVIITMSALLIVAGASVTASAADGTQNGKQGGRNTNTEVYLGVARENSADVSFEVPLYYTMAIIKADPAENRGYHSQVLQPLDYSIRNTTYQKDQDGNVLDNDVIDLAVVSVRVKKAPYSNWDLVDDFTGNETATDRKMKVSIGGLPMPSLEGRKEGDFQSAEITKYDSIFYHQDTKKYQVLGKRAMDLKVDVAVHPAYEPKEYTAAESQDKEYKEGSTVAQFQVMYTLSPVDADGNPIAKYDQMWVDEHYVGPEQETAEQP